MDPKEIARIIDARIEAKMNKMYERQFFRGVVSAVSGNKADVKLEGNTTAYPNILCLSPYLPAVGDTVLVLSIGRSGSNYIVLGQIELSPGLIPMFSGYRQNGVTSTIPGPAVYVMTTALIDTSNSYGLGTTGQFTCPRAGKYWVNFTGFKNNDTTGGGIHIRKNTTQITRTYTNDQNEYSGSGIQAIIPCAANDVLDIWIESGLTMHANQAGQLSIVYLGR